MINKNNSELSKNKKSRILVVEDDLASRNLLSIYLSGFGYEVLEAENGKKGLDLFEKSEVDLILIDYFMPVMDGLECIKKIKQLNSADYVPILFLTGLGDSKSHSECIEYGADDIILKPYDENLLKLKIESWIRTKKNHDDIELKKQKYMLLDQKHEEEMETSSKIISNFTNFNKEYYKNIKIYEQATETLSGDLVLTATTPSGHQNILIGDFTGHGLPASMGTIMVSELFYAMTKKGFSIVEIAEEINKKLQSTFPVNRFMAACLLEINFEDSVASFVQAGLPDVLIFDENYKLQCSIESKHVPLGVVNNNQLNIKTDQITFNQNTRIYIYSDGLTEATNNEDVMFGKQRLIQAIEKSTEKQIRFESIIQQHNKYLDGQKCSDDVTFVAVLCDSSLIEKPEIKNEILHKRTASEWSMSFCFDMNLMREIDPIPSLVNHLVDIQGMQLSREKLFLILKELYSNSLEHGILGLDSELKKTTDGFMKYYELREQRLNEIENGKLEFHFSHKPLTDGGVLNINLIDNGEGFDQTSINHYLENNLEYKGRGIGLLQSLTDNYHYEENGRKAHLEICWSKAA